MRDHLVLVKPPKSPERGIARSGDFESLVPPRIGGLGGRNHTQNQQRQNSPRLPTPDSRFPTPYSLLPTPYSQNLKVVF
ncbi:hypothetical protein [Moorena bouillonii]|uniref:Uncharacterized protein n=1 Tax=Moorena bouillonii PNG TaxID=568701 RepID=A0A1U7MX30_9CYAN|nr:hypothetical protein [Moorena bouillonii]OLT58239.1 hypothetical protein BJP37_03425 [Moorena bouillonii PNG]